jgi:hypothetical protein
MPTVASLQLSTDVQTTAGGGGTLRSPDLFPFALSSRRYTTGSAISRSLEIQGDAAGYLSAVRAEVMGQQQFPDDSADLLHEIRRRRNQQE